MALTTAGQNAAADGVAGTFGYLALFDGDPEGAGTEITGGSPAYARQAITWPAAAAGLASASNIPITFDVPAGANVTHYGIMSALTAGELGFGEAWAAPELFGGQGEFSCDSIALDPTA